LSINTCIQFTPIFETLIPVKVYTTMSSSLVNNTPTKTHGMDTKVSKLNTQVATIKSVDIDKHTNSEVGVLRMSPRHKVVNTKYTRKKKLLLDKKNVAPVMEEITNSSEKEAGSQSCSVSASPSDKEDGTKSDLHNKKKNLAESRINSKKVQNCVHTNKDRKNKESIPINTETNEDSLSNHKYMVTKNIQPKDINIKLTEKNPKSKSVRSKKGKTTCEVDCSQKTNEKENHKKHEQKHQKLQAQKTNKKVLKQNNDTTFSQDVDDLSSKTSKLLMTDYYPIRKSNRKTKAEIQKENEDSIISAVINKMEIGLKVVEFPNKGRGVVSTKEFQKGDFVVEYAGDIVSWEEAGKREEEYANNPQVGCYMYYYTAGGKNYCVDATAETGRFGRLFNHSRKKPNCHTKLVWIPNEQEPDPRLALHAKRDIAIGEELTFDYGDRDKKALESHPWLKL